MIDAAPRRLPIEMIVRRSFFYAWESRAILATPFAIYAAVATLAELTQNGTLGAKNNLLIFLLVVIEQMFAAAFAVGIHRFVLAGETRPGFQFLRWDRHFVQYVLLMLLMMVLLLIAIVLVLGAVGFDPAAQTVGLDGVSVLLGTAALFTVSVIVSRLALLLPSAALGDHVPARAVWQKTERNGLRLLGLTLVTALPFLVVETALITLPGSAGALALPIAVLLGLITSAQLVVVTIMLSLAYDVLVRGGGPPAR
jgi:hypothetical protein